MKYANYKFSNFSFNNIGDNMQIIAIDYIYEKMGIKKEDIVYIEKNELALYDGEYVVLPVTMPLVDYYENGIAGRFSSHIIPCFLGLTSPKTTLNRAEIDYYKKYEPIGCRDEMMYNTLKKYGIDCYIHGCVTQLLPNRAEYNIDIDNDKIFIVDVSSSLLEYIPQDLKENAEYRTHIYQNEVDDPKSKAREQYMEYISSAKVVITSLLHCAVPCMAAGIPVILIRDNVTYRMAWLEKLLPIYTRKNISEVNWNPSPVEYKEHKERLLSITMKRLENTYNKYSDIMDLSMFYETREKSEYINDACYSIQQFIEENWTDKDGVYSYSIWGLTHMSEYIYNYICTHYPNAKLCHVYDTFRKLNFEGIETIHPDNIAEYKDEYVFVTAPSISKSAKEFFDRIDKKAETFALTEVMR